MTRQVDIPPVYLRTEAQRAYAHELIDSVPLDPDKPIQVVIREEPKKRGLDLNAVYWGDLRDIAKTAVWEGRYYRAETWHEYMKEKFLPDETDFDFNPAHVKEGYAKWEYPPKGPVLCGSTTDLTRIGMKVYMQKVEAEGAFYGAVYTERRDDRE